MNPNFFPIIAATPDDRLQLFLAAATRLGTPFLGQGSNFTRIALLA